MAIIDFVPHLAQIADQASQQLMPDTSSSVSSVDLELLKSQIKFLYPHSLIKIKVR